MAPRDLALLCALASLWGASFMFIKVIVEEIGPVGLVFFRVCLGAVGLLVIARLRGLRFVDFRPASHGHGAVRWGWGAFVVVGLLGTTLPFLLISWGEQHIPSGTAGILNATAPLFAAVLAPWFPVRGGDPLIPRQLLGLAVGFGGAALLVLSRAETAGVSGREALLGELAIVLASLCYAAGGLVTRRAFAGRPSLVPATGQTCVAVGLMAVPFAVWGRPEVMPGWDVIGSLLALGLGGTVLAYVFFYELIRSVGAARALMVTYLASGMSLAYGAVLLGESVTLVALAGLTLIVSGVAVVARAGRRT